MGKEGLADVFIMFYKYNLCCSSPSPAGDSKDLPLHLSEAHLVILNNYLGTLIIEVYY